MTTTLSSHNLWDGVITCGGGPPGQLVPNTPPRANWKRVSICLLRAVIAATVARSIEPLLSALIGKGSFAVTNPSSIIILRNHVAPRTASLSATYSASFELKETQGCLDERHEIGAPANLNMKPEVDLRSPFNGPAQSESV
ncbi:predicted protein [Histoplasma mississippiense (nom. inval.)]|uniref:predicted protein n=1 Tax=Ajellomyces capsulatus (strain NAm1 / WU24) TaxID=2059318 RepID=UPI000157C690|nr:predicted protein [Histoplasma mississippiense (nom. inval.)]EDN08355.1 predicted protein [Histoplasma mississippiense (nom. inval.)]